MAKKQPRVPEMRETKPNREQRRHPEGRIEHEPVTPEDRLLKDIEVPPDPRAKNSGHKKKTADNWNQ